MAAARLVMRGAGAAVLLTTSTLSSSSRSCAAPASARHWPLEVTTLAFGSSSLSRLGSWLAGAMTLPY
jgi:hypothetical protein